MTDSKEETAEGADTPGPPLPSSILDAHHHYIDTSLPNSTFLASIAGTELKYTPEQYLSEVRDDLTDAGIELAGSVHVEAMPDDGAEEARWVEEFEREGRSQTVKAIVGSVDLAKGSDCEEDILKLKGASPKVRGVRWMVDCVGKFDGGKSKTHVATKRHDGIDYLRGSDGGYDGAAVPKFEEGYALLGRHGLTFDLQCAPEQLPAAAELAGRHPDVGVVIDHLGKPWKVLGDPDPENENATPDPEEMSVWRTGMKAMAAVPHARVKISMLGYAVPGWVASPSREAVLRDLVLETVKLFGPERCMFATNWWAGAAMSDSDGMSKDAPGAAELVRKLASWLEEGGYGEKESAMIFKGTVEGFYGIGGNKEA